MLGILVPGLLVLGPLMLGILVPGILVLGPLMLGILVRQTEHPHASSFSPASEVPTWETLFFNVGTARVHILGGLCPRFLNLGQDSSLTK